MQAAIDLCLMQSKQCAKEDATIRAMQQKPAARVVEPKASAEEEEEDVDNDNVDDDVDINDNIDDQENKKMQ